MYVACWININLLLQKFPDVIVIRETWVKSLRMKWITAVKKWNSGKSYIVIITFLTM